MDQEVQQLVEMGATAAQARAALKRYKDVMQAAERIFDGQFDDVRDDEPAASSVAAGPSGSRQAKRMPTPDEDEDDEDEGDLMDDDDEEYHMDYDSDADVREPKMADVDPYAGVFFSKDRREEVIEVEEEPEYSTPPPGEAPVQLMSQGDWMKGCPEGGEQGFLFGLYHQLSEGAASCPSCSKSTVKRKKSDFFALYPEFSSYIKHLRSFMERTCGNCKKQFCFACGESLPTERRANYDPLFHCAELQGVIAGIGLAMVERTLLEQRDETRVTSPVSSNKRRKVDIATPQDSDDGLSMLPDALKKMKKSKTVKGGVGYAGQVAEDTSGQQKAWADQRAKDEKLGQLLRGVRIYLPDMKREGGTHASDYLVHPTTLAHLRRRLCPVFSAFLRNDSLADMSDRSVLYFEMFEWLKTISEHESFASMMAQPVMLPLTSTVTAKKGNSVRERKVIYEGSSGPRELLESIVIQATAALKSLEGLKPVEVETEMSEAQKRVLDSGNDKGKEKADDERVLSAENAKMLDFCKRIITTAHVIDRFLRETKGDAFVSRLHGSLPKLHASSSDDARVEAGATEEVTRKAYEKWATRIRFEYCDLTIPQADDAEDQTPSFKHYFNNEARLLTASDIPKRSLSIAKELAVLTTNLPVSWGSSVFLRVDESRVDVIKALITGPEDTPYHNGCYLFDVFLGASYNQSPPSVKYMTTNGGRYRFNPNLYAVGASSDDGKVCLSLLGTWQGPSWVPGKSTLLQVLISIQAMILCEEPFLNEPAWSNETGTPASKAYSANVRRMVVNTAMLRMLRDPPEPFGDIVRTHFRLKAKSLLAQLDEWLAKDDGKDLAGEGTDLHDRRSGSARSSLKSDIDEMKKLLTKLQKGQPLE